MRTGHFDDLLGRRNLTCRSIKQSYTLIWERFSLSSPSNYLSVVSTKPLHLRQNKSQFSSFRPKGEISSSKNFSFLSPQTILPSFLPSLSASGRINLSSRHFDQREKSPLQKTFPILSPQTILPSFLPSLSASGRINLSSRHFDQREKSPLQKTFPFFPLKLSFRRFYQASPPPSE